MGQAQNVAIPETAYPRSSEAILPLGAEVPQVILPLSQAPPNVQALVQSDPFADDWDPEEFQELAATDIQTTDVLAGLPEGSTLR